MPCATSEEYQIRDHEAFLLHNMFVDIAVTQVSLLAEMPCPKLTHICILLHLQAPSLAVSHKLLPYNCYSIPFKSALALLLHPHLFLPPQEPKLLACASLAIFSYCSFGLRGSFTTSLLYLAIVHSYCSSGLRGSFIFPLIYVIL
jgi:hypothetical protein